MSAHLEQSRENFRFQKLVVIVGILLFAVKIAAWYLTHSVAIYSDALESIVNIISSLLGLYSLYLVTTPQDSNHPYGHGKIEFVSSAVEGILIGIAGLTIMMEACFNFFSEQTIHQLDKGIYLVLSTAVFNAFFGLFALKRGRKNNSIALQATGKHLLTDTYSTIGVVVGLVILYFTKIQFVDSLVAILFSLVILYTSYKIIRESIGGIMDEADQSILREITEKLNKNRSPKWIDLHNLRVIKYGSKLHLDLHMTLPYYFSVKEAHAEIEEVDRLMNEHFGERVELFIHVDPCIPESCRICTLQNCPKRSYEFERQVDWKLENIAKNIKHHLNS